MRSRDRPQNFDTRGGRLRGRMGKSVCQVADKGWFKPMTCNPSVTLPAFAVACSAAPSPVAARVIRAAAPGRAPRSTRPCGTTARPSTSRICWARSSIEARSLAIWAIAPVAPMPARDGGDRVGVAGVLPLACIEPFRYPIHHLGASATGTTDLTRWPLRR
jgi:hypothetical protein